LVLPTQLPPNSILHVAPPGRGFRRLLLARVVHATRVAEGWFYGCQLARGLTQEEVRELLD
jgi:hypothetical protein